MLSFQPKTLYALDPYPLLFRLHLLQPPNLPHLSGLAANMRATLLTAGWLASAVGASAIPTFEEATPAFSFDKRDDISLATLGGKILQADVYAGLAAINQQIYQATQKSDQWKKCNPFNIVVRREWYVLL